jgi:hypothetical protein
VWSVPKSFDDGSITGFLDFAHCLIFLKHHNVSESGSVLLRILDDRQSPETQ